jgi:adenylate cyclase
MPLFSAFKQQAERFFLSIAIIVFMLLHTSGYLPLAFINKLENFSYDVRLNLLMPRTFDSRIVIIDIDEASLKEQGRWPWSRNKLASLVDILFDDYHINTLGFDVVFAEKDESSGLKNLQQMQQEYLKNDTAFNEILQKIKPTLDYDQIFANSLKNRKVVLGYYFNTDNDSNHVGQLPSPAMAAGSFNIENTGFINAKGYGANLGLLQQNAYSAGHFSPEPDVDGITRSATTLIAYQGNYYDSLALSVVRAYLQKVPLTAKFANFGANKNYFGLASLQLGNRHIPVDANVATLIPYRGQQGSFEYVSASDVLTKKVTPKTLKNKIVLVGTSAAGLSDLHATPVQSAYPGVEMHANLIAGMLDNNLKAWPSYSFAAEFLQLLLIGLLLALTLPVLNPLKATLTTLAVLIGVIIMNVASWQIASLVLPIASSLVMIGLIYLMNMSYGFFVESRAKRQLTGLFGQYVPPQLVKEMASNPEAINLAGEAREMTVLFADIRGFMTISEGLAPKQLTQLMNEFLTPMTQIIHRNRGTIDKYMGYAIMAFWGAPLADNNHAQHALNAALQMQDSLKNLNEKFAQKNLPAIQIGVGLNTGNMAVGNMGSSFRMAYTVMGDSVNLGSRLEALTKQYGVTIIVSEFLKAQTPVMIYRELDIVRVKGTSTCAISQSTMAFK